MAALALAAAPAGFTMQPKVISRQQLSAAITMQETKEVQSWYDQGARLGDATAGMTGIVAAAPPAEPPAPAAARECAWFPANAAEMAPPIFSWRPHLKVFGAKPGDTAPAYLDGSLPADAGFDPLCLVALADPELSKDGIFKLDELARSPAKRKAKLDAMSADDRASAVAWMRESEIKHARLAMLGAPRLRSSRPTRAPMPRPPHLLPCSAVSSLVPDVPTPSVAASIGWVWAELFSPFRLGMSNGRAPSLFNGHLFDGGNLLFTALIFGGLSYLETQSNPIGKLSTDSFDPLGWYAQGGPAPQYLKKTPDELRVSELKNGRLAMMAITGYAVQEFIWGTPVVDQPFSFVFLS